MKVQPGHCQPTWGWRGHELSAQRAQGRVGDGYRGGLPAGAQVWGQAASAPAPGGPQASKAPALVGPGAAA